VTTRAARADNGRVDHAHAADGSHDHDHAHGVAPDADLRWLAVALAILAGFCLVELAGGLVANSVALLSDAAHMATDAAALGLALAAARMAARPARGAFTFGWRRAEILSAQVNGAALVALGVVLGVEAVGRLAHPEDVKGGWVVAVGLAGIAANLGAMTALARAQRRSLNLEGARAHVLTDLVASVAAVLAGVAVLAFGLLRADPVFALLVVVLMLRSGIGLLIASGRVLLEAAPAGIDPDEVGRAMAASPGVVEVHDLHLWEVTTGFPALAAHVLVPRGADCHAQRRSLQAMLRERFRIEHATLQVDHERHRDPIQIERAATPPA